MSYQIYFIIPISLLPLWMLLLCNPRQIIKNLAKILILLCSIEIFIVIPFGILIELKYWSILLVILPILFRILSIVINKLGIESYFVNISSKNINDVLMASIFSVIIIILSVNLGQIWYGIWLSFILFIFYSTNIYKKLGNYNLFFGVVFGIISSIIGLIYKNVDGFLTFVAAWLIIFLPYYWLTHKNKTLSFNIQKNIDLEKLALGVVLVFSLIWLSAGGITKTGYEWLGSIFIFIILNALTIALYIISTRIYLPVNLKHIILPIILLSVLFISIYLKKIGVTMANFTLMISGIECFVICFGRLIGPLASKEYINKSSITEMSKDSLTLIFGQYIGLKFYAWIFGEDIYS